MNPLRRILRLDQQSNRLPSLIDFNRTSHALSARIVRLARLMAPSFVVLLFAGVAHAQGTMDFSGAQTLMGTFKTLIVSPDNASRREINLAVRSELQSVGIVQSENHALRVLTPRSDMTGADRTWAARYNPGDVLRYQRGSNDIGIEKQSYARVIAINPQDNLLTVQKENGENVTYSPARLHGISAYRELEREFSVGDRLQFTAPNVELGVANRDLATVEQIKNGQLSVCMDNGKSIKFDANEMRHFDHGYAVTSHSSQGLTADRVLIHIDSKVHPDLINSRFAYVAVSRAAQDAQIYTNAASSLTARLSHTVTKMSAIEITVGP